MTDLRTTSDALQREVLVTMFAACAAQARAELGLRLEEIADVTVSVAEKDPSILLNRAHGLGSREAVTPATIAKVTHAYRRYGIGRYFLHVHPHTLPPGGRRWLQAAGLEKTRGWIQFVRQGVAPTTAHTELSVRRIGAAHATAFAGIVCRAFNLTALAAPYVGALVGDRSWQCYMSFDGDVPAGAGAVLIHGSSAYLGFGATDPAYRRRGSQAALLAARIQAALDAGCEHLFTETGEAVEGEDQISYRNIVRYGFEPHALCENWTLREKIK
jgi:GNAT superfamily N-acetyltransferase